MLNGEYPEGRCESRNGFPPTLANVLSKTSIVPALKFAAYKKLAPASVARARPVYADVAELFCSNSALLPASLFHAERIPSTPTKMNRAAAPFESMKSVLLALNTTPVGLPPVGPPGEGIATGASC